MHELRKRERVVMDVPNSEPKIGFAIQFTDCSEAYTDERSKFTSQRHDMITSQVGVIAEGVVE